MADLPAAVRSGLLRAVRPLVVLAHRLRSIGIVLFGVAVHGGAGPVGRRGEGVTEVAQPLVRETRASTSVRDSLKARSAVRSIASRCPASGSWSSRSGAAAAGASSCSGIAACWLRRRRTPGPTHERRWCCAAAPAPARAARSYCGAMRGTSHSPASWPGGRGAAREELKAKVQGLREERDRLALQVQQFARVVQVLELENEQLRQSTAHPVIRPLPRR
ncbi:hypothetical protein ACIRJM_45290 [Streptomyces sp. NPDC102405]|uniref:hypothetical protein n=1 Tax=Streptomyces sp. NPDC102405 TaxID=3366170 RepID=UPI00382BE716